MNPTEFEHIGVVATMVTTGDHTLNAPARVLTPVLQDSLRTSKPQLLAELKRHCEYVNMVNVAAYCMGTVESIDLHRVAVQSQLDPFPDDRRFCAKCYNLSVRGLCLAALRSEIATSRNYESCPDVLHHCSSFVPSLADCNQRPGNEPWPNFGAMQ